MRPGGREFTLALAPLQGYGENPYFSVVGVRGGEARGEFGARTYAELAVRVRLSPAAINCE
jgi:hypothetical protein